MHYVIIANPIAGRGSGKQLGDAVRRRLHDAGAGARIEWTSTPGEAESITRRVIDETTSAEHKLCVVACGGDGTVQEVVNGLRHHSAAGAILGVVPGRCNDFASAFQIPTDPDRATDILINGRTRQVDLGQINQRYFCTIAAMGFDAAVSRYVNDSRLPFTGTPAYVFGTLRVLLTYQAVVARLTYDDGTIEGPVFLVASANTPSYGGSMRIAPHADPADGLLELCIVERMSRFQGVQLLRAVLAGRHEHLPGVRFVATQSVTIECECKQEVWADGEFLDHTPVTIKAAAGSVELLTPAG